MSALITAASDSAAFRLARLFTNKDLVFASIEQMPAISGTKFIKIPSAKSPSFAHQLLKICLDNQIDEVYPLLKEEIKELASSIILFEEFGIKIIIPSIDYINLGLLNNLNLNFKLIILFNGEIVAGETPPLNSLPKNEKNGVFQWEIINDEVKFGLFSV